MSMASNTPSPPDFKSGGMFTGNFVINLITDPLNGNPDTDAFDSAYGHNIVFVIAFDSIDQILLAEDSEGNSRRILTTGPARVQFFGDPTGYLQSMIAPTLIGPVRFSILEDVRGSVFLEGFEFSESATQHLAFKCTGGPVIQQNSGSPSLASARLDDGVVVLRRFATTLGMTDFASGVAKYSLLENRTVSVQSKTFGEIKALYRGLE
jgi:hypothetical protein